MPNDKTKYKGKTIEVRTPDSAPGLAGAEEPALFIDEQFQLASFESDSARYFSWKLPYTAYPSLPELGQALIDNDLAD